MFIGEPGGSIEAGSLTGLQAGPLIEAGGVWHCRSNRSRGLLLEEIWYTRIPVRSSNISTERWKRTKALKLKKLCASFCMSAEKYRYNVDKKGQKVSSIPRSIFQKYRRQYRYRYSILTTLLNTKPAMQSSPDWGWEHYCQEEEEEEEVLINLWRNSKIWGSVLT